MGLYAWMIMLSRISLLLALCLLLGGCSGRNRVDGNSQWDMLIVDTGEEDGLEFLAAVALTGAISGNEPDLQFEIRPSKGAPINALHLQEGDADLAFLPADIAACAYQGTGVFEEDAKDKVRVIAACYSSVSGWISLKSSGLSCVHELKGKTAVTGSLASDTEAASQAAFSVMGINRENTELEAYGLAAGTEGVRDGWAAGAHAFVPGPVGAWQALSQQEEICILKYTEEELSQILSENPSFSRAVIPAGTYPGQEEDVSTFGIKMLLCVSSDMEEERAYRIARAVDTYEKGHSFLEPMQNEVFLCQELTIPLHSGAERYYRESGYLKP